MDQVSQYFKDFLQQVYECKVDYTVKATKRKTNLVAGCYFPSERRINIYNVGSRPLFLLQHTAIHELAHHIHHTEFNRTKSKERVHGKEFWNIVRVLEANAKKKALYSFN